MIHAMTSKIKPIAPPIPKKFPSCNERAIPKIFPTYAPSFPPIPAGPVGVPSIRIGWLMVVARSLCCVPTIADSVLILLRSRLGIGVCVGTGVCVGVPDPVSAEMMIGLGLGRLIGCSVIIGQGTLPHGVKIEPQNAGGIIVLNCPASPVGVGGTGVGVLASAGIAVVSQMIIMTTIILLFTAKYPPDLVQTPQEHVESNGTI